MIRKKFLSMILAGALTISAMGSIAAYAGETSAKGELSKQIETLESKYEDIFNIHTDLWDKVYTVYEEDEKDDFDVNSAEIEYDILNSEDCDLDPEYTFSDIDCSGDIDEITFINSLDRLTVEEKEILTADLKQADEINKQMNDLYEQRERAYKASMTDEDKKSSEEMDKLNEQYIDLFDKTAEIWEKVYAAETQDVVGENFDEREFIKKLDILTDSEKETLISTLEQADDIGKQLENLYEKQQEAINKI